MRSQGLKKISTGHHKKAKRTALGSRPTKTQINARYTDVPPRRITAAGVLGAPLGCYGNKEDQMPWSRAAQHTKRLHIQLQTGVGGIHKRRKDCGAL